MERDGEQRLQNQQLKPINVAALAKSQGWNDIKKFRAQLAVLSLKKSVLRVARQKDEDRKDAVTMEEQFNLELAKEIHFQKVVTQYGDANSVTKGVFSVDGSLYVTVGSSGEGRIWNTQYPNSAQFCTEVSSIKSPSKICAVDIHPKVGVIPPSAPNILTGSTNGQILLWSLARNLPEQRSMRIQAHSERINHIKFMESGVNFLSSSYDKTWALWDTRRASRVFAQKGHERQIHTSSLHPDQSLYLTADLGGFGMIWDLRTSKGIYEFKQQDSIFCSDFHSNGFQFAVAGKTNVVSIFDLRRKKELKRIPAHIKLISGLKYNDKCHFLASSSHDNNIKFWHAKTYTPIPLEDMTEQSKITSIDIKEGRLAVTCIDRKWSMFIDKLKWRQLPKQEVKQQNDI